jgi:cystathionine beta-lyase/cystathionine gamma-synthase
VAIWKRPTDRDLLAESFRDLQEDFDELAALARSTYATLTRAHAEILVAGAHVPRATIRSLEDEARLLRFRYRALISDLRELKQQAGGTGKDPGLLRRLSERKVAHADLARSLVARVAALITATDWQSPSIEHSLHSMAGRHTGRVTEHVDDYKRDRHPDADEFEARYLREYVDASEGWELGALMTSCGMSAFSTVLAHLVMDGVLQGPALVGRSVYHECRDLIWRSGIGPQAGDIDETDLDRLLARMKRDRPAGLFLDSLGNVKDVVVPDLPRILAGLAGLGPGPPIHVVIDNTGLSARCQPFGMITRSGAVPVIPIVFESLTKHAQFGLDRTTAGVIVAPVDVVRNLSRYREHLGTNVGDTAPHVVPRPDRWLLERRLDRLGRNAGELATHLQDIIEATRGDVLTGITYPGLPGHVSYEVAGSLPFRGSFLAVDFHSSHDTYEVHRRFVKSVLYEAERATVPIAVGASFGLNVTRIYVTASTSVGGTPFVRIAAGTEHRLQLEALKQVFATAIRDIVSD